METLAPRWMMTAFFVSIGEVANARNGNGERAQPFTSLGWMQCIGRYSMHLVAARSRWDGSSALYVGHFPRVTPALRCGVQFGSFDLPGSQW